MSTNNEAAELSASITALEAQRPILGDAIVGPALAALHEKLAALEVQTAAESQRKVVTILFADVSGFTAMSETMDAELMATVMNVLWTLIDRVITDQGGRIDKHIGDAVMALWGAASARESDPEQAIRAALGMQAAIDGFCQTNQVSLAMRIGINTGPVLLGQVGSTHEFTAMGDAVNLASRLEHVAPVGGVLISHDTYRHVRGIFDVSTQAPLHVKGKVEPVQTYVVQKAKPRAFRLVTRGVEGVETRMIGRDHELGMLQEACYDAIEEGQTRLVTVVGEAGVGKSRLLYEFDNWLELQPDLVTYFKGRATPMLQSVPYSLFRDLFAFRFDIRDSDSAAVALDKFRRGFLRAEAANDRPATGGDSSVSELTTDQSDLVGHWLGFDFSQSQAVNRLLGSPQFATVAQAYLVRYVRRVTGAGPVVMLLEDIHWADDSSLDLISHLIKSLPESRLLLIGLARPSLYERRALWSEGESAVIRVDLRPLSRRAGRALVDEILQRVDKVPTALRDTIVDTAEGNPFYTEELVKMYIEQDVIVRGDDASEVSSDDEHWHVQADKLAIVQVPPTLTGLLQARLDGIPQPERELLQKAAVVGRLFWDGVVADLAQAERTAIRPLLEAIRSRELIIHREHSDFAESDEFVFKHSLLRDVAYEQVLLKWRQVFHGRVARWLESQAKERIGEYFSLIAEHYQQAGEHEKAAAYLLRAGKEAFQTGSYEAARRAFDRVVALTGTSGDNDSAVTVEALVLLGQATHFLGDPAAGDRAVRRALTGARMLGDARLQAEAFLALGRGAVDRGEYRQALALILDEALPLAQECGGETLMLACWSLGAIYWRLGELTTAERFASEGLALSRAEGNLTQEYNALSIQANIASSRGDLEMSLNFLQEVVNWARSTGNLVEEGTALANLGSISYRLNDFGAARSYGLAALQKHHEVGYVNVEWVQLGNVAQAELKLGDRDAARRNIRRTLDVARDLDSDPARLFALQITAEILADEGERGQALALLQFVYDHPANDFQGRQEIEAIFNQWMVGEDEMVAAKAAAAELELDEVVAEILAGGDS